MARTKLSYLTAAVITAMLVCTSVAFAAPVIADTPKDTTASSVSAEEPGVEAGDPAEPAEPVTPAAPDPVKPVIPDIIPSNPGIYGIGISHKSVQLAAGSDLQLTVELITRGEATTNVTWTSSDPSVATVSQTGLVHAVKYGQTTITAQTAEGFTETCFIQTRFADVNDPSFPSYKPVYWAADNGITAVADHFMPEETVTRQQTVTFLWRIAGRPEIPGGTENIFSDISESDSCYRAIMWAVSRDIIRGFDDGTFRPDDPVLRNQMAIMLWRWQGRPYVDTSYNPFEDVSASVSWCGAVMWGAENGIIRGVNGYFMPEDDCQRQHVVIFLYRYARDMLGLDVTSTAKNGSDKDETNLVLINETGVFYSNRVYGVDISSYQGKVDYEKLKADDIRFVIFREGYHNQADTSFYENVKGAKAVDMWIPGIYHFCYAENKKEALEEAKACIEHVQKAGLDKNTIIFLDFEYDTVDSAAKNNILLTKKECIEFTRVFCDYVTSQGYPAGIYTNKDYYYRMYDRETIDRYVTWLAIYPSTMDMYAPALESEYMFWQYSGSGKVDGIDAYVDLDVFFIN